MIHMIHVKHSHWVVYHFSTRSCREAQSITFPLLALCAVRVNHGWSLGLSASPPHLLKATDRQLSSETDYTLVPVLGRWGELRRVSWGWGMRWMSVWMNRGSRMCWLINLCVGLSLSFTQLSTCASGPCRIRPGWSWQIMRRWVLDLLLLDIDLCVKLGAEKHNVLKVRVV